MILYQIQSFYWDDGTHVTSDWFFYYKKLADVRAKELARIVKKANEDELNSRDKYGELRWPHGLVYEQCLRRREVHTVDAGSIEPSVTTKWEHII
jgi:hypothetical protein